MEISCRTRDHVTVVAVTGRIDSTTSPELHTRLTALLQRGEKSLVLDLGGVDYMASAGLRVLLAAAKKSKAVGAVLVLARVTPFVCELLTMTGFQNIFRAFEDVEAAVAAIGG